MPYAMAISANPKAKAMPRWPTAVPDTTAAPQPKNTSVNVPINSAKYLFIAPPCSSLGVWLSLVGETLSSGNRFSPLPSGRLQSIQAAESKNNLHCVLKSEARHYHHFVLESGI